LCVITVKIYQITKEIIETKKQHADSKKHVREMCMEYRNRLYSHFQKELKGFVKEQSKWLYANSPVKLEKKDNDKIVNNIFFEAFSDAENIKAFTQRIFNQIFQLWNAQLSIAYKTKQPLNEAVLLILGRKVNG